MSQGSMEYDDDDGDDDGSLPVAATGGNDKERRKETDNGSSLSLNICLWESSPFRWIGCLSMLQRLEHGEAKIA
jgi:hypothetical protein